MLSKLARCDRAGGYSYAVWAPGTRRMRHAGSWCECVWVGSVISRGLVDRLGKLLLRDGRGDRGDSRRGADEAFWRGGGASIFEEAAQQVMLWTTRTKWEHEGDALCAVALDRYGRLKRCLRRCAVIEALAKARRGIARRSAASIMAELGEVSRLRAPRN